MVAPHNIRNEIMCGSRHLKNIQILLRFFVVVIKYKAIHGENMKSAFKAWLDRNN